MMCSLKQSPLSPSGLILRPRSPPPPVFVSPAASPICRRPYLSLKPLHLSSMKPRRDFECRSEPDHSEVALSPGQKKILDFCFWTGPMHKGDFGHCFHKINNVSLSYIGYIITGKVALEFFPYPWFFSAIGLAAGYLFMANCWHYGFYEPPEPDIFFWASLFPVAVTNAIGHASVMVSLSRSSIYFSELMRCGEPLFSMLLSSLFLLGGKWFPLPVYLSLLPIIGGCALAVATELNFDMTGFIAAMIANLAFAATDILLERGITREMEGEVRGPSYGACLSFLSFFIILPFSFAIEGPQLWATGWKTTTMEVDALHFSMFILCHCLWYGTYIKGLYQFLPFIHPFPFFTISNMRKIVIAISITFVKPVRPINALGAAIAILGIILHSRELCKVFRTKTGSCDNVGFLHTCCS